MSSQLNASRSKAKSGSLYFKLPKTTYEKYINKKWIERTNFFESKQTFVDRSNDEWKNSTEPSREEYLKVPPTRNRMSIKNFFPSSSEPAETVISTKKTSSIFPQSNQTQPQPQLELTENSHTAVYNREQFLQSKETVLLKFFLSEIGFQGNDLLEDSVLNDKQFLQTITKLSYDWKTFSDLKVEYLAGTVFAKNSKLKEQLQNVKSRSDELVELLYKITTIKVDSLMGPLVLSKTYLLKAELISEFIATSAALSSCINDRDLVYGLRRRVNQQKQNAASYSSAFSRANNELLTFNCENNRNLTWEKVFDTLIDMQNSNNNKFPIEISDLMDIAQTISANIVTHLSELDLSTEVLETITKLLPVMHICNRNVNCFINLHEFVYTPGVFETLLFLPNDEDATQLFDEGFEPPEENHNEENIEGKKGGQPSMVSKFPEIIDIVTEFIKQHGFAAQCRRRTDTGNSSGVTASQIRDHLYKTIPGLKEYTISLSTIRRLFQAPNKHFKASIRYKGHVNARVGVKSNSYREYNEDAHYLFARNRFRREMASLFKDEIGILSIDDMSKIKVGVPAVSRYHQIKTILPLNDQPNLKDHDFPVPGYLLATSGYMFLKSEVSATADVQAFSASIYDQEKVAIHSEFKDLSLSGIRGSIFKVLANQLSLHLNVNVTPDECRDEIFKAIRKEDECNGAKFNFMDLGVNEVNAILKVASSLFLSDIVLFYNAGDETKYTIVQPKSKSIEGPLYVFQHEDLSFESITFKVEETAPYEGIKMFDNQNIIFDNLGRAHLMTPHTGPASLYVRSSKYNNSTIATHVSDLYTILKANMEVTSLNSFMFLSDGGPDFNPSSVLNQLYLYRLFKTLKLDFLCVFTYAARYSAFNPIEHLWSVMSKKLSGVVFSSTTDGERKPPSQQTNLTPDDLLRKEQLVFDAAMIELKSFWEGVKFDKHEVTTSFIETNNEKLLFDDYETVKKFLSCPLRDLHHYNDITKDYKSMFKHIDRHLNEIALSKCNDRSCCEEWKSTELREFLKDFDTKLFAPSITIRSGHYDTFLQSCVKGENAYGSSGQPSCSKDDLGKCSICPNYQFKSKTEKVRHSSVFHRRQKNPTQPQNLKCDVCEFVCSSLSSLSRHKKAQFHRKRDGKKDGKPKNNSEDAPKIRKKRTKCRSIHDMLRNNQTVESQSSQDED